MKALVFGKNGQVARELQRVLPNAVFLDRTQADLSDPDACGAQIKAHMPQVVINAAAYTNVDLAESQQELALRINAIAPTRMAQASHELDIPFVHISTDYVFDGKGETAFSPDDPVGPLGVYGSSKLEGEIGVRAALPTAVILRTSWVFSAHGANFVKSMLKLSESNDTVRIVSDQIGGPTPAKDIANAVVAIANSQLNTRKSGAVYHFSGSPEVSWADFAREIFDQAGRSTTVVDIPSSEFPRPAERPLNSRLNCDSLASDYDIGRPDWRSGLAEILVELGTK